MASSVVRIDYKGTSAIFSLTDLGYITFTDEFIEDIPCVVLRIFLTFGEQSNIVIEESNSDEFEELKIIYLDLYTKWKNKSDADKEDERLLYSL